jgi:hypothetical protein
MANEKNLKPIRSVSEAREKGRKGGIKSGKARGDKKTFKDIFNFMLEKKPTPLELKEMKEKYPGLDVEKITYRGLIALAMLGKAIGAAEFARADVAASQYIRDTLGEKPDEKQKPQFSPTIVVADKKDLEAINSILF